MAGVCRPELQDPDLSQKTTQCTTQLPPRCREKEVPLSHTILGFPALLFQLKMEKPEWTGMRNTGLKQHASKSQKRDKAPPQVSLTPNRRGYGAVTHGAGEQEETTFLSPDSHFKNRVTHREGAALHLILLQLQVQLPNEGQINGQIRNAENTAKIG